MTQSYVVLGAYGGVGEALCRRLVERGARVLMAGRDAQRLAQLATDVGGETFALDATRSEEVEACLRRAVEIEVRRGQGRQPPGSTFRTRTQSLWSCRSNDCGVLVVCLS